MSDFPRTSSPALPLFVSAAGRGRQQEVFTTANLSISAPAVTTWVANLVSYMPVSLPWDFPVSRVWWLNGSTVTTSNAAFGIYTADGTRIYNTGSTTMSGTSAPQYVTPSPVFEIPAGRYYFAWTCDNTTSRGHTYGGTALSGSLWGLLQETTGAFGLPTTMGSAIRWANAFGYSVCGVTRTTTGF